MRPKFKHPNANLNIKWKTDLQKSVILENMDERDWQGADEDEKDWNFYWISVRNVKAFFHPRTGHKLNNRQIVNHFLHYAELTKKDLMVKNFKKNRKEVDKKVLIQPNGKEFILDAEIIPKTYILPQEYTMFMEEFCKTKNKKWIFKPAGSSQGKGIQLINKVSSARNLQHSFNRKNLKKGKNDSFVISRYIGNYIHQATL